jgi:hypothetical protein
MRTALLDTDAAAFQEVHHRGNGLTLVLGALTHDLNKVAEIHGSRLFGGFLEVVHDFLKWEFRSKAGGRLQVVLAV